jgi:hypothetical protein
MNLKLWMVAFFGIGLWPGCKVGATDSGAVTRRCSSPTRLGVMPTFVKQDPKRGLCAADPLNAPNPRPVSDSQQRREPLQRIRDAPKLKPLRLFLWLGGNLDRYPWSRYLYSSQAEAGRVSA